MGLITLIVMNSDLNVQNLFSKKQLTVTMAFMIGEIIIVLEY
jgi:hypothetical protein